MRSLFLILLLANLLFFAVRLNVFGDLLHETPDGSRPEPLRAERLRIVHDLPARVPAPARTAPATAPSP